MWVELECVNTVRMLFYGLSDTDSDPSVSVQGLRLFVKIEGHFSKPSSVPGTSLDKRWDQNSRQINALWRIDLIKTVYMLVLGVSLFVAVYTYK